jgi:hypothetical protein
MAASEIVRICARSMERDGNPVKFHVSCITMRSVMIVKTSSVEYFSFFLTRKSRTVHLLLNNAEHFGSGINNTGFFITLYWWDGTKSLGRPRHSSGG